MWEKFKSFLANDAYFMAIFILLVGIISFGLGRLSLGGGVASVGAAPVMQELAPLETQNEKGVLSGGPVVASKSGTKYHYLDCPGASQIKQANRIEFAHSSEAEAAGYQLARNCSSNEN